MRRVLWGINGLVTDNSPIPPFNEHESLCKTVVAIFGSLDKYALSGKIPYKPGCTAGSLGIVKVIERGINSNLKLGRAYITYPLCIDGIYGIDKDGFLSEYSVIRDECSVELKSELSTSNYDALAIHYAYLDEVKDRLKEKDLSNLCLVSSGIDAAIITMYLSSYGFEVTTITVVNDRILNDLLANYCYKVYSLRKFRTNESFDAIIITDSFLLSLNALNLIKPNGLLIIPPTSSIFSNWYILRSLSISLLVPKFKGNLEAVLEVINKIPKNLLKNKVLITKDLDDVSLHAKRYEKIVVHFT